MDERERLISFVRESLGIERERGIRLYPFSSRGSDRRFYRVIWNKSNSAILICYDPKRVENLYYGDIANFLRAIEVPVPRVFGHDRNLHFMILEDLGDIDLYALRYAPWDQRRTLYEKTLVAAYRLHTYPKDGTLLEGLTLMDPFDEHLYRWEQKYFLDEFVESVCGIKLEERLKHELEGELLLLIGDLMGSGFSLIHRDLQSQNVMIREGTPFLIDFQGIRFGSIFYDMGSLLLDPYIPFREEEFETLLSFSYSLWKDRFEEERFVSHFFGASCQRLMQALGAYGYLGLKKGLRDYLSYIPQAIENLQRALSVISCYPRLLEVLHLCKGMFERKNLQE